jgi:hypothetical protein
MNLMDHVVYLDGRAKELENLILGNKSMIIRGSSGRKFPYGRVTEGDILYFVKNSGECEISASGVVSSVFNSGELSREESFETIIRNQDKLQLPDSQFEKWAGRRYLILIGVKDIHPVAPIQINSCVLAGNEDWIDAGDIDKTGLFSFPPLPQDVVERKY